MKSILLTYQALSLIDIQQELTDARDGGQVVFLGTVRDMSKGRNVISLEFESYEPMAYKEMQFIVDEAMAKWPVSKIILHHRLGKVLLTEVAVIVGVSAIHRKEAFEACQFVMDQLKRTVPIWKKEILADGEEWVTPNP